MKFIHTADWHLGNSMDEINRTSETKEYLNWLKNQIEENKAQALVIAGDVFDTINPSVEARSQYFRFLASLLNTCCRNIIVIAGNHDSASLLEAPRDVLEVLNIHVVGTIADTPIENMVFELKDEDSNVIGICAAVPFIREVDLRAYATDGDDFVNSSYGAVYQKAYEYADKMREGRNIPIIATGHLYAADLEGRLSQVDCKEKTDDGTKRIDLVGNLGAVKYTVFPKEYDYVALGHIHYATRVAKNDRIRYSGSPFLLGFDEVNIKRTVLLVQSERGELPEVKALEVPSYFNFVRVEGSIDEIKEEIEKMKRRTYDKTTYVEIVYDTEYGRNIHAELEDLSDAPFQIVNWKGRVKNAHKLSDFESMGVENVKELSEDEIFRILILQKTGLEAGSEEANKCLEEYLPLFKEIASEVE